MKYMMLVCYDPTIEAPETGNDTETDNWVSEMDGRGVRLEGRPLSPEEATTVRVRNGEVLISDGPFAETKEALLGFYIIDCDSLDEAIDLAKEIGRDEHVVFEIRPVKLFAPKGNAP